MMMAKMFFHWNRKVKDEADAARRTYLCNENSNNKQPNQGIFHFWCETRPGRGGGGGKGYSVSEYIGMKMDGKHFFRIYMKIKSDF